MEPRRKMQTDNYGRAKPRQTQNDTHVLYGCNYTTPMIRDTDQIALNKNSFASHSIIENKHFLNTLTENLAPQSLSHFKVHQFCSPKLEIKSCQLKKTPSTSILTGGNDLEKPITQKGRFK